MFHTVYDSYEEGPNGRDYIGKHSTDDPYDNYKGSFNDKSFNPDNKIVFAYAKTKEGAVWLEIMFQKVFGVVEDPQFANKSYQTSVKFSFSAPGESNPNFGNRWKWTPEQKKKIPDRSGENNPIFGKKGKDSPLFGKKRTDEQRVKFQGENNGFFGKTHTEESRKIQSDLKQGESNPMYGKTGEDNPNFGRKASDETKRKQSEAAKKAWEKRKAQGKSVQTHDG